MEEYMELMAFHSLEPWGTDVEDDRFRLLYTVSVDNEKAQKTVQGWLDRDPEETARLKAKAEAENYGADLHAWARAYNAAKGYTEADTQE